MQKHASPEATEERLEAALVDREESEADAMRAEMTIAEVAPACPMRTPRGTRRRRSFGKFAKSWRIFGVSFSAVSKPM